MLMQIRRLIMKKAPTRAAKKLINVNKYQFNNEASSQMIGKTALVTGGNRGIGLMACKQLTDNGFQVIMGCRDLEKGAAALRKYFNQDRKDKIELLQIDICDEYSISDAVKKIECDYDNIDVLVNNAGINHEEDTKLKNQKDVKKIINTIDTNYYGTIRFTEKLLPHLRNSRIICLSNRDAALKKMSEERRKLFLQDDLEQIELNGLMEQYKKDAILCAKEGICGDNITMRQGWINSPYLMSYAGINIYCKILGNKLKNDIQNTNWIGSYCPGHCATESSEYFGGRNASEGAWGIFTLSTMMLDETTNNGCFWAAFYRSDNLDSVELELMDLEHPEETISWDAICNEIYGDDKIQSFE